MEKIYLKNSIISFVLIVSFILMPLSFLPRKAEATGISGYIGNLSTVIGQMPLCKDAIVNGVKSLFSGGSGGGSETLTFTKPTSGIDSNSIGFDDDEGSLPDKESAASSEVSAVPVVLPSGVTSDITTTKNNSDAVKKSNEALKNNDTCLKSIGRAVIKMLLQKITLDTVNWINGGYDDSPLFVQNPGDYFLDIAKNEILGFGGEISDPNLYPFGKAFMQAQVNSFTSKFANNAQYSLNKMIQDTNPEYNAQTFNSDFSQGGWAAWDAMTQNPANNPLGFTLMASNELAKRIEDKTQLAAGSLQQSGGYLGVQKCVDPEGVTKQQDDAGLKEREASPMGPYQNPICNKWNFVTPGKMVADAATKTINYPDNNLLKAEDLNDAVAAILDAILNNFNTNFISEGGFAGLTDIQGWDKASEGQFIVDNENMTDYNQVGKDFSGFQVGASSFLAQNPNFNIRTDLNQATIDEQRIYQDKIKEQNKELMSSDSLVKPTKENGYFTGYNGLIPVIAQLDYCIPGPHPGWESDSRDALDAATGTLDPTASIEQIDKRYDSVTSVTNTIKTSLSLAFAAAGLIIGATVGSIFPGVGTVVGGIILAAIGYLAGLIVGWLSQLFNSGDNNPERKARAVYASELFTITAIRANFEDEGATPVNALVSKESIVHIVNVLLDRYINTIHYVFDSKKMPSITAEAATKFFQMKGYGQMFKNNEDRIISMKSIVERLTEIKNEIDTLNSELEKGEIKDKDGIKATDQAAQYEENLKPWISAFGRLSQDMVTGDDIATVDNTIKQIVDEKDYVYSDLLKGPNGCEQDLAKAQDGFSVKIYETQRMTYPAPILYDYNKFGLDEKLPDPYNSGYKDNVLMTSNLWSQFGKQAIDFQKVGPGFLSWVNFDSQNDIGSGNQYWYKSSNGDGLGQCPNGIPIIRGSDMSTSTEPPNFDDNPKRNTPGVPYGIPNDQELACRIQTRDLYPPRDWTTAVGLVPATGNFAVPGIFEGMIGVW